MHIDNQQVAYKAIVNFQLFFFFKVYFIIIQEKGGEVERNINLFPPSCATGNWTSYLSVYGTMLQSTEPHQPGLQLFY